MLKEVTSILGYQQVTGMSTATALTVPQKDANGLAGSARLAIIRPEVEAVRWRDDGVPSSSVGMPLGVGDTLYYDGDLTKIKFIEQTSGAILNVSYYA